MTLIIRGSMQSSSARSRSSAAVFLFQQRLNVLLVQRLLVVYDEDDLVQVALEPFVGTAAIPLQLIDLF